MEDEGVVCFNALAMILLMSGFGSLSFLGKSMPLDGLIDPFRAPGMYTGEDASIITPIRWIFGSTSGPELLRENETLLLPFAVQDFLQLLPPRWKYVQNTQIPMWPICQLSIYMR